MKRFIAVSGVFCILISLCSCKIKSKSQDDNVVIGTPEPMISYDDKEYTDSFPDSSGKVIATIEVTYPEFSSEYIPDVAETMNEYVLKIINDKADDIKMNLDNTADVKTRFNISDPTITKVAFEIIENNEYYLSFSVSTKEGVNPDDSDGFTTGYTFCLLDGSRLTLGMLLKEGAEYDENFIKNLIIMEANETYANGADLEDDKVELMNSYFDPASFCATPDGLIFYYSYSAISGGSVSGIYECLLTYADIYRMDMSPEEYYNLYIDYYN